MIGNIIAFICIIVIIVCVASLIVGKKQKSAPQVQQHKTNIQRHNRAEFKNTTAYYEDKGLIVSNIKLAGVTFKDGRYSRQASLRKLKFNDEPMIEPIIFDFEEYEYNGSPAVYIKANGRTLGNVPADYVSEFIELKNNHQLIKVDYRVSGGGDYSFGCKMYITWKM